MIALVHINCKGAKSEWRRSHLFGSRSYKFVVGLIPLPLNSVSQYRAYLHELCVLLFLFESRAKSGTSKFFCIVALN